MRYGYFDDEHREYVITRPDTPLPWLNYLGTDAYVGIISNTAGGYSCYRDARLRRLTRYRYNGVPADSGGRYLYLRDNRSGEYWSPSWQPTQRDLDSYECRHGLSYTRISSARLGVRAETLYFVPPGETLEVWRLRVRNERSEPADLSVFSSVEFCLWDAQDDATNFQRNFSTGEVEVDGGVIYHKTEYRERRDHFAYFACSEPLAGFDTQREEFLGPYRGWDRPLAVERGESANSVAHGWAPHGSHHVRFLLAPGETREVIFLLGYWENPREAKFDPPGSQILNKTLVRPVIDRWLRPETVAEGFRQLRESWSSRLSVLQVGTPDQDTNRMVNIWNPYQCMVTFAMSRSVSLFESGISRGIGFRDSCQDLLGFVQLAPGRARARILDLAATQLASGGAYHQYQPLTKTGNDAIGSGFNDDPLWLVLGVAAYLKETGDEAILDEPVPYADAADVRPPLQEHLERSLRYTLDRLGPHQLPLIGRADWNDCLNLNCFSAEPGQSFQTTENVAGDTAESVFIGGLFVLAAREYAPITERRGQAAEARYYRAEAEKMAGAMLQPTALALLRNTFPPEKLNRAIGVWGAVIGASTAAGPIVGGLLVQHISWESCFYVNVPVGAAALIMSLIVLRETPRSPAASSFDIPGIAALSGALFLLIWGLIKGSSYGWGSARTMAFLGGALVVGLLFVLREHRTRQPLLLAGVAGGLQSTAMQVGGTLGTAVLGAVMSARISSLLPASWAAAHLPALNPAQLAEVKSAVSVGAAPVTSSTPPQVARVITDISHATFASGMHTAFLVAAGVALAGALIGLLIRPGTGGAKAVHAGI